MSLRRPIPGEKLLTDETGRLRFSAFHTDSASQTMK
jgi:hypothetical protein